MSNIEKFLIIGSASQILGVKIAYELGMRNPTYPMYTLSELEQLRQTDSSVFVALNDNNGFPFISN